MHPEGQGHLRVLLEVVPRQSLLAAIDQDEQLAGNPHAADRLSQAGMRVDPEWPALELGPARESRAAALERIPPFKQIRETVNRMSETVNKVGDALPFDVQVPAWEPPERQTVLFRAEVPSGEAGSRALAVAEEEADIVGVFNDAPVALAQRGPSDPAHGTVEEVENLMGTAALHEQGLTGEGVPVVIVDSGINLEHLRGKGRGHDFDEFRSYVSPNSKDLPGKFSPGHGTLSAFQVGIAAPKATLVDHGVIVDRVEDGDQPLIQAWLSDIQPGYVELHRHLSTLPPSDRKLVVSNSWAMISPDWDFPPAHAQNFSDNKEHPFSRMVCALVDLGADVLFSAGNCGTPKPARGCRFAAQPICGANSLEEVITVGAVDIDGERLGYSSQGPGRIVPDKPDLCGYSHYKGSGVGRVDWGTSTACPGVAGVVAAIRTRHSPDELRPHELKQALLDSAQRPHGSGHNPDTGYGIVDPAALLRRLG